MNPAMRQSNTRVKRLLGDCVNPLCLKAYSDTGRLPNRPDWLPASITGCLFRGRNVAYTVKHCQTEANIYAQVSTDAMCDSCPTSFREQAFLE